MHSKLKRVVAGLAALAVTGVTPLFTASPAGAATLAGPATVKTANGAADMPSGDANDTFTLRLPAGAACAADGNNGGRWHTYMIPGSQNPATDLAFNGSGGVVGASTGTGGAGTFKNNLYSTTGTPVRGNAPNLGDAAVINIPNMNHNVWTAGQIPSGVYNIGIACVDLDLASAVDNFWNKQITVTYPGGDASGAQISWAVGAVPAAPTGVSAAPGSEECVVTFTPGASDPPATSYTATANPGGFTATGAGSPLTITGLTNNTTYNDITVTATNAVGTSAVSSPAASCTPVPGARNNVTGVAVSPGAPGSGAATVDWTLPAANTPAATPTGYDVVVTGPTASTSTVAHPGTSKALTGLATGSYNVTVTARYADNPTSGTVPASTPVSFAISPASVVYQQILANRPVGALVLTQVCGSTGGFAADSVPEFGFPSGHAAFPAANPSTVDAPTAGGSAPTLGAGAFNAVTSQAVNDYVPNTTPGQDGDPKRGQYPYPTTEDGLANPNYPTYCGIDLGAAKYVTRGGAAGKFFATEGVINQITIVDTRDDDPGWTVTGTMSDFTTGTDSFSGNQLGWTPRVTETTASFADSVGNTYDQVATDGGRVAPNTLSTATGLRDGKVLASAAPANPVGAGTGPCEPAAPGGTATSCEGGLGTAILDARVELLIPVHADSGNYVATLTISAA